MNTRVAQGTVNLAKFILLEACEVGSLREQASKVPRAYTITSPSTVGDTFKFPNAYNSTLDASLLVSTLLGQNDVELPKFPDILSTRTVQLWALQYRDYKTRIKGIALHPYFTITCNQEFVVENYWNVAQTSLRLVDWSRAQFLDPEIFIDAMLAMARLTGGSNSKADLPPVETCGFDEDRLPALEDFVIGLGIQVKTHHLSELIQCDRLIEGLKRNFPGLHQQLKNQLKEARAGHSDVRFKEVFGWVLSEVTGARKANLIFRKCPELVSLDTVTAKDKTNRPSNRKRQRNTWKPQSGREDSSSDKIVNNKTPEKKEFSTNENISTNP